MHFISLYLIDTVGLNEANKLILEEVTVAVKSLKGPWVIAGDWNLSPETLAASGFLQMIGGALFSPADPTCNDNRYGFFVVSKALSFAVVGAQRVDGVHMKPHRLVRLLLRGDARRFAVRKIIRPPRVSADLPFGPRPGGRPAKDSARGPRRPQR